LAWEKPNHLKGVGVLEKKWKNIAVIGGAGRGTIIQVRTADRQARVEFEAFFDRHYPVILNYTMRRLMNMADAEDAASETFSRAFANVHDLESEPRARQAWLFRKATNIVDDLYRRRRWRWSSSVRLTGNGRAPTRGSMSPKSG
jgi:DNA-directed RNA polymerase specialized sigma24 family protein